MGDQWHDMHATSSHGSDSFALQRSKEMLQAEACRLSAVRDRLLELESTNDTLRLLANTCSLHYLHVLIERHALSSLLTRALVEVDMRAIATDNVLETVLGKDMDLAIMSRSDSVMYASMATDLEAKAIALCNEQMDTVKEAFFKLETLEAIIAIVINQNKEQFEAAMAAAVVHKDAFGLLLLFTAEKEQGNSWKDRAFFLFVESVGAAIVLAYEKNFIDYLPLLRYHPKCPYYIDDVFDLLATEPASRRATEFVSLVERSRIDVTCVQMLLATNRVDPCASDNAVLFRAVSKSNVGMVRALLADSRVNPASSFGATTDSPLLMTVACNVLNKNDRKDSVDVFDILQSDGRIDPSALNNQALLSAVLRGNLDAVNALLAHPRINLALFNPASPFIAVAAQHPWANGILRALLVDGRADPSVCGNEALKFSTRHYSGFATNTTALLADARVNPNESAGEPVIVFAARLGMLATMRVLLADKRMDPSIHGMRAFEAAHASLNWEMAKLLYDDDRIFMSRKERLVAVGIIDAKTKTKFK